ncbi:MULTISPECIES: hypothetical protein [Citrobacter]|nr:MULTISPECIES: hypothetical protein [Citrobacter]HBC8787307.1 hypothetical protein [Citrobacter braakii]MCS8550797.1 hypothetical protein [Citrobacter sp. XY323]MDM3386580.1 hypothetical protein [Citrobacter sp. Cb011]PMD01351.1 hypothetical protein CJ200_15280 [Citrobacter freundii]WLV36662.1 hypothetical protein M2O47_11530 [Citrobacter freundii]
MTLSTDVDRVLTFTERLEQILIEMVEKHDHFFDFLRVRGGQNLPQTVSVKNEKFKISIPLIMLILLITRLIVFKLAIMYKLIRSKMLEVKALSKVGQNTHNYLFDLDTVRKLNIKGTLCHA